MSSQPESAEQVYREYAESVVAEDAPLGVLLWPVRAPEFEPNFTLESVAVVRDSMGSRVIWTYQNGTKRTFRPGEKVSVKMQ